MADEINLQLAVKNHPLRAALNEEMHTRKLPGFGSPAQLLQFIIMTDADEAEAARQHLDRLMPGAGAAKRFFSGEIGQMGFAMERHTEFTSYTFIAAAENLALGTAAAGGGLFDTTPFAVPLAWLMAAPGQVVRATLIALVAADSPLVTDAALAEAFVADDLVACDVADGRARIWSDFRLRDDGLGRLLILDQGMQGSDPSMIVQRLQEIGNYRNMALLGLPVAQRMLPHITALEERLTGLTQRVDDRASNDQQTLEQITSLSAELATITAQTRYRMGASRAYVEICMDRIARLAMTPLPGYPSLSDFTERRLLPAMRTCDAFSRRLDDLTQRTAWTSSLLRTRVDIELAHQNRDLLASMNARSDAQLRLQQAVEGLSVAAVSYYLVGLAAYVVPELHPSLAAMPKGQMMAGLVAVVVPLVMAGLYISKRRITRRG